MTGTSEKTGVFDASQLSRQPCTGCGGTGELRIDSENIDENFVVEKQTVITPCVRCEGTGFAMPG